MRCRSCNEALNDFESTRKYAGTNIFVDLCNSCFHKSDEFSVFTFDERDDLNSYEVMEDE